MRILTTTIIFTFMFFKLIASTFYEYRFRVKDITNVEVLKSITDEKIRPLFSTAGTYDEKTGEIVIESEVDLSLEKIKNFTNLEIISFSKTNK